MSDELLEYINGNHISPLKLLELTSEMNTVDIAEAFDELGRDKVVQMFRLLPKSLAADVFAYLIPEKQQIIIEALTDDEAGKIINELFVDDAVDFVEEMPASVVKRVLRYASEDKRRLINQLLQYPEDSAGSIMTTEFVDLKEDMTVGEAFDYIRATGVNKETIYTCYVIKRDRELIGVVTVKTLFLAEPADRIGDIMDINPISAHTTDDQEAVANLFSRYGLLSLPVVDKENRLVGIVTVDDIVQVIEDETTEDVEIMAALTPSEVPYMKTGPIRHTRNRFLWLLFLMLSATITAAIIASFEEAVSVLAVLVAFIPMLMNTGGSAGCQCSALIIRGLALGEIYTADILRVLWKEIRVGLLCGTALAIVNFIRVFLMNGGDYMLGATVSISLLATIVISKFTGCLLPIAAKKLRLDPAIMSAPLITTIVDGASLLVYFSVAVVILKI